MSNILIDIRFFIKKIQQHKTIKYKPFPLVIPMLPHSAPKDTMAIDRD